VQREDELVSREAGISLFDAFGSSEKTLHANTGLQDVTTNPLDDSIPPWAFARLAIRFDSIKMWIRSIIGVNESLGNRR